MRSIYISFGIVLFILLSSLQGVDGASTFVINATDDTDDGVCDSSHCSLREAIHAANALAGLDTLAFDISGTPPFTIQPLTELPEITDSFIIDGTTQPGYSGTPIIELDGSHSNFPRGLVFTDGGNTVRGLVINQFELTGIDFRRGGDNIVQGNYIGTDVTGTIALGNKIGIEFEYGGNNLVGGTNGVTPGGACTGDCNLISSNSHGIGFRISDDNIIQGNFFGTDVTGTVALGEYLSTMIALGDNDRNLVGGVTPEERNIISGSVDLGVTTSGNGNVIQGNYIGTDTTGTVALSTNYGSGIFIAGAQYNIIGGTAGVTPGGSCTGACNVISGYGTGIKFYDGGSDTTVQGNFVGTDVTGTQSLGNITGISIEGSNREIIGGPLPEQRNIISGNQGIGIRLRISWDNVIQGNYIGVDTTGENPLGNNNYGIRMYDYLLGNTIDEGNVIANNYGGVYIASSDTFARSVTIRGNSIYNNSPGLGIDLNREGVNLNDFGDIDVGANQGQNYPVLTSATSTGTTLQVSGEFNSLPNATYTVDFYANQVCDDSGYGEGEIYLGFTDVSTDGGGNATVDTVLNTHLSGEYFITSTATDINGSTSEFSACILAEFTDLTAPSNLIADAVSQTQIDLNWVDNSNTETSFHIERSLFGNIWSEIGSVDADVTTFVDTEVTCNTIYYYRVRAYRESDELYSNYSNEAYALTPDCDEITPEVTPSDTPTNTPTPTNTLTSTPTLTPTDTPEPTATDEASIRTVVITEEMLNNAMAQEIANNPAIALIGGAKANFMPETASAPGTIGVQVRLAEGRTGHVFVTLLHDGSNFIIQITDAGNNPPGQQAFMDVVYAELPTLIVNSLNNLIGSYGEIISLSVTNDVITVEVQ